MDVQDVMDIMNSGNNLEAALQQPIAAFLKGPAKGIEADKYTRGIPISAAASTSLQQEVDLPPAVPSSQPGQDSNKTSVEDSPSTPSPSQQPEIREPLPGPAVDMRLSTKRTYQPSTIIRYVLQQDLLEYAAKSECLGFSYMCAF